MIKIDQISTLKTAKPQYDNFSSGQWRLNDKVIETSTLSLRTNQQALSTVTDPSARGKTVNSTNESVSMVPKATRIHFRN